MRADGTPFERRFQSERGMAGITVNCPECGSSFLRWSRRSIWERPLRLLFLRPYRCRSCRHRAYVFTWRLSPEKGARRSASPDLSNPTGTARVPVGGLLVRLREGQHGLLSKVRSTNLQSDRKT